MKGDSTCHIPNDKYRAQYQEIKKPCGCKMGTKCKCMKEKSK